MSVVLPSVAIATCSQRGIVGSVRGLFNLCLNGGSQLTKLKELSRGQLIAEIFCPFEYASYGT